MEEIHERGRLPQSHKSHDHLNKQVPVELDPKLFNSWKEKFDELSAAYRRKGLKVLEPTVRFSVTVSKRHNLLSDSCIQA